MSSAAPTRHIWKFFRTGGLDQVSLETTEDLLSLGELDQKLWVALSCPVKGLELDEKTLALIDGDNDGHIHVREVVAAVKWAADHLKNPAAILTPDTALPLAAINDATDEGKTILASAKHILASLGKPEATTISVEDTADTDKILSAREPNGDGVVTLMATTNAATQALIKDIMATVGGVSDSSGGQGVNAKQADAFFAEIEAFLQWADATSSKNIPELGEETGAACAALRQVKSKVDDFFARCRLAAFDRRALAAVNRQETEYLAIAAKDLSITASEVAGFPLAHVEPDAALPLIDAVNPAWAAGLAALHRMIVVPLFGAGKRSITADDWAMITAKFAPYEAWLGSKAATSVEKLGAARARELVQGPARAELAELIKRDQALAPEYNAISSVARLARYYRDLRTLLHNFTNFADFYSHDKFAVFQAGVLFLDSRSCELCIRVADAGAHAGMATMSKAYIAYLDCKRTGGETMKVAACFTQGDSDYLFVGRNGLFYDRAGRDWDATITKIIDNPISIRQAFWLPYKKFLRMIEEQVAKRAAAAEASSTAQLQTAATAVATVDPKAPPAPPPPPAPPKKPDLATIIGLSVALGSIGTFVATVFTKFIDLPSWQIPLVIIGIMLAISLPSMVIAWLKIRQRTIAPMLEANGWAINGRVKVNIPFGTALTERALLPSNAKRMLTDPYEDKGAARRRRIIIFFILVIGWLVTARVKHWWPFQPEVAETTTSSTTPAAPPPAPEAAK